MLPLRLLEGGHGGKGIPSLLVITAGLAAAILVISSPRLPLVVNPVICYIGKISYSCYLVHFAALGIALRLFGLHLTNDHPACDTGHPATNLLLFLGLFFTALALTACAATVTLHLIENPGIELGRRLLRRIGTRQPAPAAPASAPEKQLS